MRNDAVVSAKILKMSAQTVRLSCRVAGNYDNTYHCEIEIDRRESMTTDSDCDCPHKYDCHHLAAFIFYLEDHFEEIIVAYSKETDLEKVNDVDETEKATLLEAFKEAETKEVVRRGKKQHKELLQEYTGASQVMGRSPFFLPEEELAADKAELAVVFAMPQGQTSDPHASFELQLALAIAVSFQAVEYTRAKGFF